MPYAVLLNDLISKSGLSVKEIADRCKQNGQEITPAYISLLRNTDNKRIPSDEMSRALAIACNAKYDNLLVIEGYLDKAPEEILTVLVMIRDSIVSTALCIYDNQISKKEMKAYQDALAQMPLAEIIIESAQQPQTELEKGQGGLINLQGSMLDDEVNATVQISSTIGLPIKDDSMFPILPKGCKTILEMKNIADYQDGDILCFSVKGKDELLYRKCTFVDGLHKKVVMVPMNTQYPSGLYCVKDIVIFGKVKQSITDF